MEIQNYQNLFIPFISNSINAENIFKVFELNLIGQIDKIILIPCKSKSNYEYKEAYIHITHYYNTNSTIEFLKLLQQGKSRIIYDDDDKYWNVYINNNYINLLNLEDSLELNEYITRFTKAIPCEITKVNAEPYEENNFSKEKIKIICGILFVGLCLISLFILALITL